MGDDVEFSFIWIANSPVGSVSKIDTLCPFPLENPSISSGWDGNRPLEARAQTSIAGSSWLATI